MVITFCGVRIKHLTKYENDENNLPYSKKYIKILLFLNY